MSTPYVPAGRMTQPRVGCPDGPKTCMIPEFAFELEEIGPTPISGENLSDVAVKRTVVGPLRVNWNASPGSPSEMQLPASSDSLVVLPIASGRMVVGSQLSPELSLPQP